jgi:glycerate-2-kinase
MAAAFTRETLVHVRAGLIVGPPPSRERSQLRVARFGRQVGEAGPQELPANFDWLNAGHPLPNDASERAGGRALDIASGDRQSTLVVLLSGGASAMLASPAEGITLHDKVRTARTLMQAGVSIDALNCVREAPRRSKAVSSRRVQGSR